MRMTRALLTSLPLSLLACGDAGSPAGTIPVDGSFARLQNEVLVPSCATGGCHVSGSGSVVLGGSGAYDALVNATPTHTVARTARSSTCASSRPRTGSRSTSAP